MARRPPATEQEYREALELLEAGHKQTGPGSVAELLDRPDGTVGRWATAWKQQGILRPDHTVDWDAFEKWVQKKVTPSHRVESPRKPMPKSPQLPTVEHPQEPIPIAHTFGSDEGQVLKELISWWKEQTAHGERPQLPTIESPREPTIEGPRTRRHMLINDEVWKQAKRGAKRQGLSVGDLVNEAILRYLEGYPRTTDE